MPLVVITGMFPNTLPLPSGLKLTTEKLSFTLSDAIVLLVACWLGLPACVFVAGRSRSRPGASSGDPDVIVSVLTKLGPEQAWNRTGCLGQTLL